MKILKAIILFLLSNNFLVINKYKIEDVKPVTPVYWISKDTVLINEENRALIFNTQNREVSKSWQKNNNQIYGYSKKEGIIICQWENRERHSIDEYSTHLQKFSLDKNEILNIELKQTVEVLFCQKHIILRTIPPIQEKYFKFTKNLYEIDNYFDITNIKKLSPNLRQYIFTDELNTIWIWEFSFQIPI